MNCRLGDLAYVFRSEAGNYGKVVTCLRLATAADLESEGGRPDREPCWIVDRELACVVVVHFLGGSCESFPLRTRICPDSILRPLGRPGEDAIDETLQRLPAPSRYEVMA